jgi:hypothetical protein
VNEDELADFVQGMKIIIFSKKPVEAPVFLFPLSSIMVTEVLLWIGREWMKYLFFSLFLCHSNYSYFSGRNLHMRIQSPLVGFVYPGFH